VQVGVQVVHQFQPAHLRHHIVGQQQRRTLALEMPQCLNAVERTEHAVSLVFQQGREQIDDELFIIDDQNRRGHMPYPDIS